MVGRGERRGEEKLHYLFVKENKFHREWTTGKSGGVVEASYGKSSKLKKRITTRSSTIQNSELNTNKSHTSTSYYSRKTRKLSLTPKTNRIRVYYLERKPYQISCSVGIFFAETQKISSHTTSEAVDVC